MNAFWSVTMYDGKTQLLIKNPINRYLINSPMLPDMKKNADGSLTLYIQKDSPGKDKEANWLPAPDGPIYLVMRLYWPKTRTAVDPAAGQGHLAAAGIAAGELIETPPGHPSKRSRHTHASRGSTGSRGQHSRAPRWLCSAIPRAPRCRPKSWPSWRQNPVGNLVSVPFQNNTNFNTGPASGTQNILNIQPVIPIEAGRRDWNLITRTILPLIWQPAFLRRPGRDLRPGRHPALGLPVAGTTRAGRADLGRGRQSCRCRPTATTLLGNRNWGLGRPRWAEASKRATPGCTARWSTTSGR